MKQFFYFVICFTHLYFAEAPFQIRPAMVIWNVGQGSWATKFDGRHCRHFDVGGEVSPLPRVQKLCRWHDHEYFISHWDWDHISFFSSARKKNRNFCVLTSDLPKIQTTKKKWIFSLFEKAPSCSQKNELIFPLAHERNSQRKSNDQSLVFLDSKFLFPGDSTMKMEKIWRKKISPLSVRVLILGHHGSRTSTSDELLNHLHSLKMTVASARSKRYGHPHPYVTKKLKLKKIPILLTEKWGNIWFLL